MKTDYFKDTIREQHKLEGGNLYRTNYEYVTNNINDSRSNVIVPVNLSSIEKGKFYFMLYDLQGKSSKMEKFNPLFVIDWNDENNTRYLYAVSINFIPVSIRTVFFNSLCNFNLDTIEDNKKLTVEKQESFDNINFATIYKLLYSIGFEWSIRKFDCKLINKIYGVSTEILPIYITMSTAQMTGVDDGKIIDIWHKKIQEQEQRHNRMIKELVGDYEKMNKELTNAYKSVDVRNDNLEKSLQLMKGMF